MTEAVATDTSSRQSDLMLWVAAAAVVGIGATWLFLSAPWSSPASSPPESQPTPGAANDQTPPATQRVAAPGQQPVRTSLDNPLRLAQLAYEAGMLVEPEEYSAWTLFERALDDDGTAEAARQGLGRVADDLIKRAAVAVEQGRYDDAEATTRRILDVLPEHASAAELAARVENARPQPVRSAPVVVKPEAELAARASEPAPAKPEIAESQPAPPPVRPDPIPSLLESFEASMAGNQLLTPADANARYYVERMLAAEPDDERTRGARDLLVTELLSRSSQAIEALDWDAARTWIDQAETLAADPSLIASQRDRLAGSLVAREGATPIPVTAFTVKSYVQPEYPRTPLQRGIEGWVDVEFTVGTDGRTRDIDIVDASHDRYFRNEAMAAVEDWTFEPRSFMDRPIEQRTYTRLKFELTD